MNKIKRYFFAKANAVIRHTDWYNNILWGGVTKFWLSKQFGLDVVNLGSGAAVNAFNYEGLPIKADNWALSPQSIVHDFNILKNYFSYIKEGGYVIITICPFSGLFSNYDKKHNFKYYSFLHPATISNFDECERQKALRLKHNPIKEMPSYCIKRTAREYILMMKNRLRYQNRNNLRLSSTVIMESWKTQFAIVDLGKPLSKQHEKEIESRGQTLRDIVMFCKERNLKPCIVIPVMSSYLSSLFPKNFKSIYMEKLLDEIDVPILDYMYDEIGNHDEYFETALLLNNIGAKIFTAKVICDLKIM